MPKKKVIQGGGIIVYNGTVVLRRSKAGRWIFPKGHVDPGETIAQAALREAEKETGLLVELVEPVEPIGSVKFGKDKKRLDVEYYILRALGPGPRWERHHNADTFLMPLEQVAVQLSFGGLRRLWERVQPRVTDLAAASRP